MRLNDQSSLIFHSRGVTRQARSPISEVAVDYEFIFGLSIGGVSNPTTSERFAHLWFGQRPHLLTIPF
jgi:hypothetical protein